MTEMIIGLAILATCVQLAVAVALWIELHAFRKFNAAMGEVIIAAELQQRQLYERGLAGAINARLAADQAQEDKARAH